MDKYCKVHLGSVKKCQMENYKITKGIKGEGEEIEPVFDGADGYYPLEKGVYLCQFNGKEDDHVDDHLDDKEDDHVDDQLKFSPIDKMFTVSEDELGQSKYLNIPKIRFENKEAEGRQPIYLYSDSLEEQLYNNEDSSLAQLDRYKKLGEFSNIAFDTPAWNDGKTINQFTTNQERWEFLESYLGTKDYYLYRYGFPVVIFTNENIGGCDLLSDLEVLKNSDKLNILYQAQVHGNEYAAGEGAMAVVEKLVEDNRCLGSLNIVMIPCVNEIGNTQSTRDCGKININRDFLKCEAEETVRLHEIFFRLMPELVVDAHTFTRKNSFLGGSLKKALFDVRISRATTLNGDKEIDAITDEIVANVIDDITAQGMRAGYYGNSTNCNLGRLYYNLLGGCSILLESEGTRSGKFHFKRNVASQVKGALSIISFACREKERIKEAAARHRKKMTDGGYINTEYVFEHGSTGKNNQVMSVREYDPWGAMINGDSKVVIRRYDEPVRVIRIPGSLTWDRDWFEGEMEDLFLKNHVAFEKRQDKVFVNMSQIAIFVIVELLRNTEGEL